MPNQWAPSQAYNIGDEVAALTFFNRRIYVCQVAGTSAAGESFAVSDAIGDTINDAAPLEWLAVQDDPFRFAETGEVAR